MLLLSPRPQDSSTGNSSYLKLNRPTWRSLLTIKKRPLPSQSQDLGPSISVPAQPIIKGNISLHFQESWVPSWTLMASCQDGSQCLSSDLP